VPLLRNVHPEMSAYIVVTPTPYFTLTDADGNYKIANVLEGQYTVSVWHEGMTTVIVRAATIRNRRRSASPITTT